MKWSKATRIKELKKENWDIFVGMQTFFWHFITSLTKLKAQNVIMRTNNFMLMEESATVMEADLKELK